MSEKMTSQGLVVGLILKPDVDVDEPMPEHTEVAGESPSEKLKRGRKSKTE